MRRIITILGIFLTVMILISGTVIAVWHYADHVELYYNCTNPDDAVDQDDGNHATLGVDTPSEAKGWIILDLDEGNEMDPNQNFTVYASSAYEEIYIVNVSEDPTWASSVYVGEGNDTMDHVFTTPTTPGKSWRYILIAAKTAGRGQGDSHYGPEVDAVGWEE